MIDALLNWSDPAASVFVEGPRLNRLPVMMSWLVPVIVKEHIDWIAGRQAELPCYLWHPTAWKARRRRGGVVKGSIEHSKAH